MRQFTKFNRPLFGDQTKKECIKKEYSLSVGMNDYFSSISIFSKETCFYRWEILKIKSENIDRISLESKEEKIQFSLSKINAQDAIRNKYFPLYFFSVIRPSPAVVQFLLAFPSLDVNATYCLETALMGAASSGYEKIVSLLLSKGEIQINLADDFDKMTVLMKAAQKGHTGVVKLLLEQPHINVTYRSDEGKTALDLAMEKGHDGVVPLLQKRPS